MKCIEIVDPRYIKSIHRLQEFQYIDSIPESFSVNMDVLSLYSNIPNNEGIKRVETVLKRKIFKQK